MAIVESPFGTYADVTGVVNATAAAEVVVLVATLKGLIPDAAAGSDHSGASPEASPEFDAIRPEVAQRIRAEIDALAAAIAAAPTA
jgi:hypothetical protein